MQRDEPLSTITATSFRPSAARKGTVGRIFAVLLAVASPVSGVHPETWSEDFESGNSGDWRWTDGYAHRKYGGNPGGWLDTGQDPPARHPYFSMQPAPGSALKGILAGGQLHSVAFDFVNLPPDCPTQDVASGRTFTLRLLDFHSGGPDGIVYAQSAPSDVMPYLPTAWRTFDFAIPAATVQAPEGWRIFGPAGYGWSRMLHNVDALLVFATDSGMRPQRACRRLGIDNIVIGYGNGASAR